MGLFALASMVITINPFYQAVNSYLKTFLYIFSIDVIIIIPTSQPAGNDNNRIKFPSRWLSIGYPSTSLNANSNM